MVDVSIRDRESDNWFVTYTDRPSRVSAIPTGWFPTGIVPLTVLVVGSMIETEFSM